MLIEVRSDETAVISLSEYSEKVNHEEFAYMNVGYFFHMNGDICSIDVSNITHLNYSFALVHHKEERNEQEIPEGTLYTLYLSDSVKTDLANISVLKRKNPVLKVLLSVGGWGCRGFSDSAATEAARNIFAESCRQVIDSYDLDGIDLDWEYPVNGGGGIIKAVPEDRENFTLLLQAVRSHIGNQKLLTIASAAIDDYVNDWTEISKIDKIVDFINIMTYDMAQGSQYFNAPLFPSHEFPAACEKDNCSIDSSVRCYLNAGIDGRKLNLGIPFYGRAPRIVTDPMVELVSNKTTEETHSIECELPKSSEGEYTYKYREIVERFIDKNNFVKQWDMDAKVPYLLHHGKFAFSYEDEQSIEFKAAFIKKNNLGGAMFWDYSSDYNNVLARKIASELSII